MIHDSAELTPVLLVVLKAFTAFLGSLFTAPRGEWERERKRGGGGE